MKYYTYKITFRDLPKYFYYGYHRHNGKEYFGSPTTWKHLWEMFEPEVQILCWYKTWEEAKSAEYKLISTTWKEKYSLNENCGGNLSTEACRKGGKITGQKHKENKTGFFSMTKDQWSEVARKGGKNNNGGKRTVELGVGIHTFEARSKGGKKGGPIGGRKSRPSIEGRKKISASAKKTSEEKPWIVLNAQKFGAEARRIKVKVTDLFFDRTLEFKSVTEACEFFSIKQSSICAAMKNNRHHKGYLFERL